jgi:hypothetical protein
MERLNKIAFALLVFIAVASGCETILDADSDSLILSDEHQLNSPGDTLYSMIGIFTQLEKLAERYVLLGELRADLMDITANSSSDLLEINDHNISEDNKYNAVEDYYAVINNCNYLISNIDTSIVSKAEKVMYKEFAAAKSIRAWTYFQLALNYGKVKYYSQPILDIAESENYVEYSLNELIPHLIKDIEPWKDIDLPGSISLGSDLNTTSTSFFPIRFVLGDLYLWSENYEAAASEYHDLMVQGEYLPYIGFKSSWTVENRVFIERELENTNWPAVCNMNNTYEQISIIAESTENGKGTELYNLSTNSPEITPSEIALENWDNQVYYYSNTIITEGDLRGDIGSYLSAASASKLDDEYGIFNFGSMGNTILKYSLMTEETAKAISVYRTGLLYLRYAEAVNQAGKPNLAFATLKNGLNSKTMAVDTIVPRHEKYSSYTDTTGIFIDYADFEDVMFSYSIGIHARGCGNTEFADSYSIPELSSLTDSIKWVEDKIIEELALETAFEGNRFHDLMRISLRRRNPEYLANMVAKKYDNSEAIRSKLMDESNWYLK